MRMWFCSSGLGPGPSVGITPFTCSNGLAGPSIKRKKNAATTSIVAMAHPTIGSVSRLRKWCTTTAMYPVRMSDHRMIEPSSADQSAAKLNSGGVRVLPLRATYDNEKSRVMSARSMATNVSSAPTMSSPTYRRDERSNAGL